MGVISSVSELPVPNPEVAKAMLKISGAIGPLRKFIYRDP
jgi:hypothetical protein